MTKKDHQNLWLLKWADFRVDVINGWPLILRTNHCSLHYWSLQIIIIIYYSLLLLLLFKIFTPGRYNPSGDIIVIIEYYCLEGQVSSSVAEGKVPRKATRLNRLMVMVIERRWKRNAACLLWWSTFDCQSSHAEGSSGLTVSIATCVVGKPAARNEGEQGRAATPRCKVKNGVQNELTGIYFDIFWRSNGPQRGHKIRFQY